MALTMCPRCSQSVSDEANFCPDCGGAITGAPRSGSATPGNVASATLGFFERLAGYSLRTAVICPHCGNRGGVAAKRAKTKRGISGAKATGALLTGGLSLLATGLSRKEWVTDAKCKTCGSQWQF